jgi:HPt (histidine-containing phosphotransfer) domain-containing protein
MALARLAGDDLLLRDVLGIFLDDAPRLLGEIRECVDRSDAPGLKHAAHTLKGVAANFAAPWAIQSMQALETLARSGDLSRAPALLPEVETSVSRLIVEVEQELNIRDSGPTRLDPLGEPVTALLPRMADAAESLAV